MRPADRVATFDNDGTLWSEQPIYFQFQFALDRIKALAPQHPEWKDKEPFNHILAGNMEAFLAGGEKAMLTVVAETHTGITTDEFQQVVKDWFATARHPETGQPYNKMVTSPCSSCSLTCGRTASRLSSFPVAAWNSCALSPRTPTASRATKSSAAGKLKYEMREGVPVLVKVPEIQFVDDKEGKPAAIQTCIGRRPIAAFGNSDGDLEMLEWATSGPGMRFGLIVHHTDADREWAYDRHRCGGR